MAFDSFLKIEGIPGESQDDKHKGEIEVLSFSFGISREKEKGRANLNDFTIVKRVDLASPLLFDAACQGEVIKDAHFTARKAGEKPLDYIKIRFEECVIAAVQPSGAAGTETVPMESVSLDFRSMEMEVFRQKEDGSLGDSTKTTCTPGRLSRE